MVQIRDMHECWLGSLGICLGPRHSAGAAWQHPRPGFAKVWTLDAIILV